MSSLDRKPQDGAEDSSISSNRHGEDAQGSETTPLLSSTVDTPRYNGGQDGRVAGDGHTPSIRSNHSVASSLRSSPSKGPRWPSIIAMVLLALVSITIILVAFFVPAAVEEYAKEAAVLEPTNLSLESITTNGVRARIQANFRLDGRRVKNDHVRRVGKASTWVVRQLGTEETNVKVYLPEYDNVLVGTAGIPAMVINLREGQTTAIDFVADLTPGNADGIRMIANEWLEGRLDVLRIKGETEIRLKSGIIPLGTHTISESLTFEGNYLYRSFASLYFGEKTLF